MNASRKNPRSAHALPEITTVIPVYNGEPYLISTLRSVAAQTRHPDRLVLLDDQSTDNTREIAAGFPDIRCEVVRNPKNLGLFGNHNRALQFASETVHLHILHANDLILPEFYARLLPLAQSIRGKGLVYSLHQFIDEKGQPLSDERAKGGPAREIPTKTFLTAQSELKAIQLHSALLRSCGEPAPVEFRLDFPQVADCIFHSHWAQESEKIIEVPELLCQVRVHPDSATSKNIKNLKIWSLDEWRAMEMISGLIPEGPMARWLRRQKLKCLYAARNRVKIQVMQNSDPQYAREIGQAARALVSAHHWILGGLAVALRNALRGGRPSPQLAKRQSTTS